MQIISEKIQKILPHSKIDIFGSDQLLHNVFPYYILVTTIIISYFLGLQAGFSLIFLTFTVVPILDEIFSLDLRNPTYQQVKELQKQDKYFKVVLYATAIIDWIWFFRCIQIFSETELSLPNTIKLIAFVFIFGFFNALQFSVAHQLIHKQGLVHRFLGTFHIVKNFYVHYPYTHLYTHHRKVATPQDPATASQGASLYKFFPRTFLGTFTTVYDMEKKKGKPFITNYCVLSIISSVILISLILKLYGVQGAIFFVIQAFISIFVLQIANYIQHYGLERQKLADGTYEKVTIRHSWNAPHRFSNYLLFKVQRHSDHHVNSQKPYQTLLSLDQSPQLPHGYTVCLFLSLFPSIWFKIMDPVLEQYRKTKNGNMSGQVMQRALKETRKFIIQLGIYTTLGLLAAVTLL